MARIWALSFVAVAPLAAGAPEPQITARAALHPRADSSILGYISTSGASELTDLRSCLWPATLTQSGSYAQCCEADKPCDFFTTCSAGNVIAESTSIFCNWGYCNTAVMVPSAGDESGKSVLGCWATDIGERAFYLVQDGSGVTSHSGRSTTTVPSLTQRPSDSRSDSSAAPTGTATESFESESETETGSPSPTGEITPSSSSPGAAAGVTRPLTGFVGFIAGLLAVL
ncbi:hypothetical protein BU23DRAFT_602175 [Bimuria novae-zelandiae CBS 107.79]|uniref:Extracellular membrane protein CFEM domain-containing protein n=1 Tax=Bimuria novae-zelandiae CBS 107.79 TaxID=1447943 RepID=A0A6A5V544_9PLEO|nr:hypothetical protein BU23DRAFT_602175 [Bimuria novae-zelandiae CBS 107.79]